MNGDLTPALVAAGGGSAMIAGIWLREHRQAEAMRRSRVRLALRFPVALDPAAAQLALSAISGVAERMELVSETGMTSGRVTHAVLVPEGARSSVISGLTAAIPSMRAAEGPEPRNGVARAALRVFVPTPCVLSDEHPEATLRNLAGFTFSPDERVTVRFAVRPGRPRHESTREPQDRVAKDVDRAWRQKTLVPAGFQVVGLALVQAPSAGRASELAGHLSSIFRARRGPVAGLRLSSERDGRGLASLPRVSRSSGWLNQTELLPLLMWPMGETAIPGVEVSGRELTVPRDVAREGRPLFIGRDTGGERPVALDAAGALHHMAVVGPSGVGKSALLARGALSDIERGFAGLVIDPKADLIETILGRIEPGHAERVVVLDPGDGSRPVPGIDVLHGNDPDTTADVLTRTLKSMFPDWGIRSETWGRLAIRTLSDVPGATLLDMGRLFSDEPYRRAAVARLRDDYLISSWQNYEALSPAAKVDVVQAPMARVMALLSRPKVRAVLASPEPKLDMARLFAEKRFLLVSLAPGVLGEAAALIGSAVMFAAWSAIEARVALPPEKRHLINLHIDELATLTNGLPNSFELIAERARGLGAGLTVALQTLSRVPEPTKSALLGNAATFISFRAPAEEATAIARQLPGLTPEDVKALSRFEVAARVGTGVGSAVSIVTGRTEPLPPETGQANAIRDRSAKLYGSAPIQSLVPAREASGEAEDERPPGRARRRS